MKYNDKRLKAEINAVLDDLAAQHEPWRPQWITHQICSSHRLGLADSDDDHVAFWDYGGYTTTRKFTTECINDRADPPISTESTTQQLALPGFAREHLQDYYVVVRDDEDIAVCVLELTDGELFAKAALYRSHSRKALAHAEELERFADWRRATFEKALG
jgi:hypothetical protein